jgi:hypothetical protein
VSRPGIGDGVVMVRWIRRRKRRRVVVVVGILVEQRK